MTKKTFEINDKIGRFTLTELGGTDGNGVPFWWAQTESGKDVPVSETRLRKELRVMELTPDYITKLSAKAYDELRREVGEDEINRVLGSSKPQPTEKPPIQTQYEIANKWFEAHPQVPQTRNNVRLFDKGLAELSNPTYTSRDYDLVFEEVFEKLELHPQKVGIEGFGEGLRGETARQKFTSAQLHQIQKSFPVAAPVDFSKISENEILREVAKSTSADGFIEYTREVDREKGIEAPLPPLVQADRERTWSNFFQLHPEISPTDEIKTKLLDVLAKNGLPVQSQYLTMALDSLIEAGDPSVTKQESTVHRYSTSRLVLNEPRSRVPLPAFDPTAPVTVSVEEINKMDAKTYNEKLRNPRFKEAVDALYVKVSGA